MLIRIYPDNPSQRTIKQAVDCLRSGGVIIYPTDTVYALACDINNVKAVDRIAQIKGVKKEKAKFSIAFDSLSHLSNYTKPISNEIFKLMKSCLPGAFTFILQASNKIPKIFHTKKKTVGIRVPDNNIALEIIREFGSPIVTTSIKDDDDILEYTTDPELIYEKYENLVDLVVDGGFGGNIPSTIVDCVGGELIILREGKGVFQD